MVLPCRVFSLDAQEPEIRREIPVSFVSREGLKLKNEIDHALNKEKSPPTSLVDYIIKVYTGDKKGAGTDANVHVILFGDEDSSELVQLTKPLQHQDPFERGKVRTAESMLYDVFVSRLDRSFMVRTFKELQPPAVFQVTT